MGHDHSCVTHHFGAVRDGTVVVLAIMLELKHTRTSVLTPRGLDPSLRAFHHATHAQQPCQCLPAGTQTPAHAETVLEKGQPNAVFKYTLVDVPRLNIQEHFACLSFRWI